MSIVETTSAPPAGFESYRATIEASADAQVEVVETPLSWVFLTNRHAYKIKKAVDVGEARFRAPAARRLACLDELWLNRRLAPGVYLGVAPLAYDANGVLRLGGRGAAVEWAVKMRRLRQEHNLAWLVERRELTAAHVAALAKTLGDFYLASPPETTSLEDVEHRLRRRLAGEPDAGRAAPAPLRKSLQHVRAAQAAYLDGARTMLRLRICDGRLVDGHGDLRPEHVFLERQPAIIDCVEYSAARRRSDALDDLGGLTMECRRLGRDDVADALMEEYRRRTGDESFPHLAAFYRSLHACTRAEAALARGDGGGAQETRRTASAYLAQAQRDADVFA